MSVCLREYFSGSTVSFLVSICKYVAPNVFLYKYDLHHCLLLHQIYHLKML